jgi:hypothetical protein
MELDLIGEEIVTSIVIMDPRHDDEALGGDTSEGSF